MTTGTLQWLHWLVSAQQINIAAPDAPQMLAAARQALSEIETALAEEQPS